MSLCDDITNEVSKRSDKAHHFVRPVFGPNLGVLGPRGWEKTNTKQHFYIYVLKPIFDCILVAFGFRFGPKIEPQIDSKSKVNSLIDFRVIFQCFSHRFLVDEGCRYHRKADLKTALTLYWHDLCDITKT